MSELLQWTRELAQTAGTRLLNWFGHTQNIAKPDGSIVTQADREVDALLTEQILRTFPNDAIISEELNTTYGASAANAQALWVIDPLDGTTNFANGLHFWGVSIARLVGGIPDLAVLYWPVVSELYSAQRGQGAFLGKNPIHTRPQPLQDHSFLMQCTRTERRYHVDIPCKRRVYGAAAYDLCALARGLVVGSVQTTPHLWDIAAGWLLVQEAGGAIATLNGSQPFPPQIGVNYVNESYPVLAAANLELWQELRSAIRPKE